MNPLVPVIADKYGRHFPGNPLLVVSPGRVNLIGEHTDYNEGFVLPGATDKAVVFAVSPRADGLCHLVSHDFEQEFRCELGAFHRSPLRWPDYLQGVVDQFLKAGHRVGGFSCVFGGDIPVGAGMSSSAALEGARALGFERFPFEREALRVVVSDPLVRRELASSEYNVRRGQCEAGVNVLRTHDPSIRSLRDATLDLLREHRAELA